VQLVFDIGAQEHTRGGLRIDASHHRAKVSASIQAGLRRVSTRVRVTTAARFASKVARSISNVCCRALSSRAAPPNWPGWPHRLPSGLFHGDKPRYTNSPPGSLRAGLLLDCAVSGNRQIPICRAPGRRWRG
jgi:hypothetical protein